MLYQCLITSRSSRFIQANSDLVCSKSSIVLVYEGRIETSFILEQYSVLVPKIISGRYSKEELRLNCSFID